MEFLNESFYLFFVPATPLIRNLKQSSEERHFVYVMKLSEAQSIGF